MGSLEAGLKDLVEGRSLGAEAARRCFEEIVTGRAPEAVLGAFLAALRMKGETPEEIAAFASVMREKALAFPVTRDDLLDTCGTGGDGLGGFNVSTLVAFVAAGAGAAVAKHGNRAVSGRCGSADLLSRLGVSFDGGWEAANRCLDQAGIAFLFAPAMHPAMQHAAPIRRALGIRTVFNLLGPLSHPARVPFQLLGVYERRWVEPVARALAVLGARRALVVHGLDGMDEITTTAPTAAAELDGGKIRAFDLDAGDFGIPRARAEDLQGGGPDVNESIARSILGGEKGPRRDLVVINAAAALYVAGRVRDLREGIVAAEQSLDSGKAARKLEALARLSRPEKS